jgi:hypothetical protein
LKSGRIAVIKSSPKTNWNVLLSIFIFQRHTDRTFEDEWQVSIDEFIGVWNDENNGSKVFILHFQKVAQQT